MSVVPRPLTSAMGAKVVMLFLLMFLVVFAMGCGSGATDEECKQVWEEGYGFDPDDIADAAEWFFKNCTTDQSGNPIAK